MLSEEFKDLYFPHDEVRPIQEDLIRKIRDSISNQQNLLVHAPTGLGKTAAALAPSIREALKKDLTIFFLTSRHTQHKLAMDTIKQIKNKYRLNFVTADIIGKKWLCLQPDVLKMTPRDFSDYCQRMRDDNLCEFYSNTKKNGDNTPISQESINTLKQQDKTDTVNIFDESKAKKLCPYEVAISIAKDAKVIIGDYYYIFHPSIRESFMKKCNKELSKSIIIIDEGHNLPERIKDLASHRISSTVISRAIEEAKKGKEEEIVSFLKELEDNISEAGQAIQLGAERYLDKDEVTKGLDDNFDVEHILELMEEFSGKMREEQRQSYVGATLSFLEAWNVESKGFIRIISKTTNLKGELVISIQYRCLDPSIITKDIIRSAYTTILMSGTLSPTGMYNEVLGFDSSNEATFKSPFPEKNKLNIIIPKTSTKYETRNTAQYKEIAETISRVTNKIPGNSAVFFPSYQIKDDVEKHYSSMSDKTVFSEKPKMTKQEKEEFLESFKKYKESGAVILGVIAGNFSEGVDLPGDYLKGVIIVGLPLQRPDLETEALIKYYDEKFKKGWDYGYLLPAFNKALQSAGRCIRTETDKGVIVFLDERYAWKNYFRCFPPNWDIKITLLYEKLIEEFFKNNN